MRKVFKKSIIFYCIFLLTLNTAHTQVYKHLDYLTTKDGLASNYITRELVTTDGYLWVTSNLGLSRYDGRKFVDVSTDIPTAVFKDMNYMIEYPENVIWFLTRETQLIGEDFLIKNIYCYDTEKGELISFKSLFPDLPFDTKNISFVYKPMHGEGVLIIVDHKELFHLNSKSCIKIAKAKQGSILQTANIDAQGDYWWIINEELWKQEDDRKILIDRVPLDYNRILSSRQHLFVDRFPNTDNISVVEYPSNIEIYKTEDFPSHSYFQDGITHINPFGTIVVPSKDSLYIKNSNQVQSIPLKQLSDNGFYKLFRGLYPQWGNFAILTGDNGIHIFDLQPLPFRQIQHSTQAISCRGMNLVDDSILLVNSYSGQLVINRSSGKVEISDHLKGFNGYGISINHQDYFWHGTHGNKIVRQNRSLNQVKNYFIEHLNGNKPKSFSPFYHKKNKELLLGTSKGLFKYDVSLDRFVLYDKGIFASKVAQTNIYNLRPKNDSLWICTEKGLFLKTPENSITAHYAFEVGSIIDIYVENETTYWLATYNKGILRWNPKTNETKTFDQSQGLSNNAPTCIYPDYLGNLWIPTFNGVNYLNTKDFSIQTFYKDDGIAHNEFNYASHFLTQDSFLYLGGINGITEIDLRYTAENTPFGNSDLPLVKNEYTVYNDKNEINIITDFSEGIVLNHGDTYFDLNFSIVDFSGEPTFDFAYQIEGLHEDWIYKKDAKLQLSKPKFGEYLLHVKAKGIDGRWSKNELSIPITSNKPFFLKAWFLSLIVLFLAAIIYLIVKWRSNYLEQENLKLEQEVVNRTLTINHQLTELQQMQTQKQRIYSIIGHDLRSPILGMLNFSKKINFLITHNRLDQLKQLSTSFEQNLKGISSLLDNLLDWSRLEEKRYFLDPKAINMTNILEENIILYQSHLKQKELIVESRISDTVWIQSDHRAASTIIRNLLDNAIKYAPKKSTIFIVLEIKNNSCQFSISNKGILANPLLEYLNQVKRQSKLATDLTEGLGLNICKELIVLNKGQLSVENLNGGIVQFSIQFDGV